MTGANKTSPELAASAQFIEQQLDEAGLSIFGRVRATRNAFDLALWIGDGKKAVVRCTDEPLASDLVALRKMIAEGDFDRAFLVHSDDATVTQGDISTYPISRIDELAALLANEAAWS